MQKGEEGRGTRVRAWVGVAPGREEEPARPSFSPHAPDLIPSPMLVAGENVSKAAAEMSHPVILFGVTGEAFSP